MDSARLEYALAYAELGWAVLPIIPRDKVPLTRNGLHDASCDPGTIEPWSTKWPEANIGIACAKSGFVALDIDPRHGGDETFCDLVNRLGILPPTVEAGTGGGGRHLLFHHPDAGRLTGSLGRGVDVRSNGYIVVEPSLHASGGVYRWRQGSRPFELELAQLPTKWVEALLSRVTPQVPRNVQGTDGGIAEGSRNATLA